MGGLAEITISRIDGIDHAIASMDKWHAVRLRNRLEDGERRSADILRAAIAGEAPVGDPSSDPNSGRLKSDVVIRPYPGGGFTIGPRSAEANEAIKIMAVIHGRRRGNHGVTLPNPFVDRGAAKVRGEVVRLMTDAVLGR